MVEDERIERRETTSPPYLDSDKDTGDDIRVRPGRGSTYSTPGWVKVFGIIVLVLILLAGIVVLTGLGGDHGPGRHIPSIDTGSQTPFVNVIEDFALSGSDLTGPISRSSVTEPGVHQRWQ